MVGECPKCKSVNLDYYGSPEFVSELMFFPFTCCDCGAEGREWFTLEYVKTTISK